MQAITHELLEAQQQLLSQDIPLIDLANLHRARRQPPATRSKQLKKSMCVMFVCLIVCVWCVVCGVL